MHVAALLPSNLLTHLRVVLGEHHSLSAAGSAAELYTLLRSSDVDVLVVDPVMHEERSDGALDELVAAYPQVPAIVYTTLTPAAMRQVVRLARLGLQHVVLNRFDDEPSRFLDLIERAPAHPLAEAMLQELASPLRALPVIVTRAIEQLFRSPARVKNTQELANLAGMIPRTLYRHLMPVGLQPRQLLICARLLRTYTLVREPGVRIKEVAKQTRETYVITNNHFRGQAVVNAIEIKAALEEEPVPAPEPLFKVYPRLSESATPDEPEEKLLFK